MVVTKLQLGQVSLALIVGADHQESIFLRDRPPDLRKRSDCSELQKG